MTALLLEEEDKVLPGLRVNSWNPEGKIIFKVQPKVYKI